MPRYLLASLAVFVWLIGTVRSDDDGKTSGQRPVIPDEPQTVDPAAFMPPALAAKVTVEFTDSSLREVAEWLLEQHGVVVLFDDKALSSQGIPLGEQIVDRLHDDPIYLLLDRLRLLGLAWYYDEDLVHITSAALAKERQSTIPYSLGELLDAGFDRELILDVVLETTGEGWSLTSSGAGQLEWLGDVLFIRQNAHGHREAAGVLGALQNHGRQTFAFEPPQHVSLRATLARPVSVRFRDVPLADAIHELAEKSGVDMRLDPVGLRQVGVREREPVNLTLRDRSLRSVLHVALSDFDLTWMLRDGVLWVTSEEEANALLKTAVYDVRDLCSDMDESNALADAILSQTAGPWIERGGQTGNIRFAKPGTMAIRQTEGGHHEIATLLSRYRAALQSSRPRVKDVEDPDEIVTRYYRLQRQMAMDLNYQLRHLVAPKSWIPLQQAAAIGQITPISSRSEIIRSNNTPPLVVEYVVLIIQQTRSVHKSIAELISKVKHGDKRPWGHGERAGGGGFGGSF